MGVFKQSLLIVKKLEEDKAIVTTQEGFHLNGDKSQQAYVLVFPFQDPG